MYPANTFDGDERKMFSDFPRSNESYLVECCRAFILEDLGGSIESAGVSRGCLQADFDNIW